MRDERLRELRPPPALAPFVECVWLRAGASSAPQRVLPDGCADVLFDRTGARHQGGLVVGPMTTALVVPQGVEDWVAVRFRPGAAHAFLGVPLAELADGHADLRDVWQDAAEVEGRVLGAPTAAAAAAALLAALAARLPRVAPADARARAAIARVARAPESTSVEALAAELGLTRQHLARLFARHVGLSPKVLARVLRLRRALALLEAGRGPLALLALEAGYCDQAHLCREVKALSGLTPAALLEDGARVDPGGSRRPIAAARRG